MRWAEVERIPIHPRGRGTSLSGGACPPGRGWLCPCSAWIASLIFPVKIFVAVIEPGVQHAGLSAGLRTKGLFYPPDPARVVRPRPWGGNVMTCAGGLPARSSTGSRGTTCSAWRPSSRREAAQTRRADPQGRDRAGYLPYVRGQRGHARHCHQAVFETPSQARILGVGPCRLPLARRGASSMSKVFAAGILPCAVNS